MKREIKFRGKVVKHDVMTNPNNGWVEGSYYQDLCGGEIRNFIKCGEMDWEVLPETIGQYTGLKDKNGEEIYGGILSDLTILLLMSMLRHTQVKSCITEAVGALNLRIWIV